MRAKKCAHLESNTAHATLSLQRLPRHCDSPLPNLRISPHSLGIGSVPRSRSRLAVIRKSGPHEAEQLFNSDLHVILNWQVQRANRPS